MSTGLRLRNPTRDRETRPIRIAGNRHGKRRRSINKQPRNQDRIIAPMNVAHPRSQVEAKGRKWNVNPVTGAVRDKVRVETSKRIHKSNHTYRYWMLNSGLNVGVFLRLLGVRNRKSQHFRNFARNQSDATCFHPDPLAVSDSGG